MRKITWLQRGVQQCGTLKSCHTRAAVYKDNGFWRKARAGDIQLERVAACGETRRKNGNSCRLRIVDWKRHRRRDEAVRVRHYHVGVTWDGNRARRNGSCKLRGVDESGRHIVQIEIGL
jgi:hypothetical protein